MTLNEPLKESEKEAFRMLLEDFLSGGGTIPSEPVTTGRDVVGEHAYFVIYRGPTGAHHATVGASHRRGPKWIDSEKIVKTLRGYFGV